MTIRIPLKKKYLVKQNAKRTPYRGRTGPRCCNANCPASRTKRDKARL